MGGQAHYKKDLIVKVERPGNYENSGYLVFREGNNAYITRFSHCSCNGTWDGGWGSDHEYLEGHDWAGAVDELIQLARAKEDLGLKGKPLDIDEYGAREVLKMYELILEWDNNGQDGQLEHSF